MKVISIFFLSSPPDRYYINWTRLLFTCLLPVIFLVGLNLNIFWGIRFVKINTFVSLTILGNAKYIPSSIKHKIYTPSNTRYLLQSANPNTHPLNAKEKGQKCLEFTSISWQRRCVARRKFFWGIGLFFCVFISSDEPRIAHLCLYDIARRAIS